MKVRILDVRKHRFWTFFKVVVVISIFMLLKFPSQDSVKLKWYNPRSEFLQIIEVRFTFFHFIQFFRWWPIWISWSVCRWFGVTKINLSMVKLIVVPVNKSGPGVINCFKSLFKPTRRVFYRSKKGFWIRIIIAHSRSAMGRNNL